VFDMGTGDQALERARTRISELRRRAAEIGERNQQQEPGRGSSPEDVRGAVQRAEQAQANAVTAHAHAATALRRSAAAHEAGAARHEALAAEGFGDTEEHRRRARPHREMSAADNRAAGEVQSPVERQ
jgi:hypothetical protein